MMVTQQQQQPMAWGATIWSGVLVYALPTALQILASIAVGVAAGFESRGDQEAINAAVAGLANATWYMALPHVLTALTALWRGIVMGKRAMFQPVALLVMALVATALNVVIGVAVFGLELDVQALLELAVAAIVMLAFGFLGARLGGNAGRL